MPAAGAALLGGDEREVHRIGDEVGDQQQARMTSTSKSCPSS
jgi:hypothetical protein